MVPNLANIAENYCFPKNLPTSVDNRFSVRILPIVEMAIVSIDETMQFGF